MNSNGKIILLTLIIAFWLFVIGYSLSCLIAYLIGWPPMIVPIALTIVSLLAIFIGVISKRKQGNTNPFYFIIFGGLLISNLANWIILGNKFSSRTYNEAVIETNGYLYNKWGYKIMNVRGTIIYDDDIYLLASHRVYVFNRNGEFQDYKEYKKELYREGSEYFIQNPYTLKYHYVNEYGIGSEEYSKVTKLGISEDGNSFFNCINVDQQSDIIGFGDQLWAMDCIYIGTYKHNGRVYCFQLQRCVGCDYEIIDVDDNVRISSEYKLYNDNYKQFYYYDEYHQKRYVAYD